MTGRAERVDGGAGGPDRWAVVDLDTVVSRFATLCTRCASTSICGRDEPVFSFEFFPPKTPEGEANLFAAVAELRALEPAYVSVTYGAGGSTRDRTLEIVTRISDEYGIEAMAHFTCVGATAAQLRAELDRIRDAGIENVLALRGDPPAGETGVDERPTAASSTRASWSS